MDKCAEEIECDMALCYQRLLPVLENEVSQSFQATIQHYAPENIYSLALYHNGDCSGYMTISFSTEQGLEYAVQQCLQADKDDGLVLPSADDIRARLRWSPCDSPYHCLPEFADLTETTRILDELSALVSEQEEACEQQLIAEHGEDYWQQFDDDPLDIVHQQHSIKLHDIAITALTQLLQQAKIAAWLKRIPQCVVNLSCGDRDDQQFLADIQALHSKAAAERLERELQQGYAAFNRSMQKRHGA